MCLYTTQQEPKTADKDIVVYKKFRQHEYEPILRSLIHNFTWQVDDLYETPMTVFSAMDDLFPVWDHIAAMAYFVGGRTARYSLKHNNTKIIVEGFHAALTLKRLIEKEIIYEPVIHRCIIPKGAKYYIDTTDLIVSDKLIVKERINLKDYTNED